ncbi:MAG: serine protease [Rubrivivax sp.]|nr:serine protease [Rubrivivax sp.]MDP3614745.1 serine protease [Rubrivivax sp.]
MQALPGRRQALRWGLVRGFGLLATLALPGVPARADLAAVIAAAKPSVLPVGTFNATSSPRFTFRGSGFVVGDGNLVATNFHVLPEGAEADSGPTMMVMVSRSGDLGQFRRAKVVATDRARDLALLRFEGTPLAALALEEPATAPEGLSVALMGFPIGGVLGFAAVTHRGIIASVTTAALPATTAAQLDPRALMRLREGNFEIYQLDATAYPGNSGGPVLNAANGRVVAIVNMVLIKAGRESALSNPTGISYAIPVRHLHDLLKTVR